MRNMKGGDIFYSSLLKTGLMRWIHDGLGRVDGDEIGPASQKPFQLFFLTVPFN